MMSIIKGLPPANPTLEMESAAPARALLVHGSTPTTEPHGQHNFYLTPMKTCACFIVHYLEELSNTKVFAES